MKIAANIALRALKDKSAEMPLRDAAVIRAMLERKSRDNPDFWSVAGQNELDMYEAIVRGAFEGQIKLLLVEYEDLNSRVSAVRKWRSLYDTARLVLTLYSRTAKNVAEQTSAQELLQRLSEWSYRKN